MTKALLALAAFAVLGGCGEKNEKTFNESFDRGFRESCVTAAGKSGAPVGIVGKVCDCAVTAIDAKYSTTEKLTLSDKELNPIMTQCVNSVVQK
jgi:hypothetical protein